MNLQPCLDDWSSYYSAEMLGSVNICKCSYSVVSIGGEKVIFFALDWRLMSFS